MCLPAETFRSVVAVWWPASLRNPTAQRGWTRARTIR